MNSVSASSEHVLLVARESLCALGPDTGTTPQPCPGGALGLEVGGVLALVPPPPTHHGTGSWKRQDFASLNTLVPLFPLKKQQPPPAFVRSSYSKTLSLLLLLLI